MPKRQRKLTDKATYNAHPILTDQANGFKCDKKIIDIFDNTVKHMIEDHKMDRIYAMHYVMNYPQDYKIKDNNKNSEFRSAQAKAIKHLTRKGLNPHYVAVRETSESSNEKDHYHAFIFVDERKSKSSFSTIKTIDKLWANSLGVKGKEGLVEDLSKQDKNNKKYPDPRSHTIKINSKNFQSDLDSLMEHGSYLAKELSKDAPKGTREVFSSRLHHGSKEKQDKSK